MIFVEKQIEFIHQLEKKYPEANLEKELDHFRSQL